MISGSLSGSYVIGSRDFFEIRYGTSVSVVFQQKMPVTRARRQSDSRGLKRIPKITYERYACAAARGPESSE